MIALPENAIDPAIASARPGHTAARGGGAGTGGAEAAIDSPVIAAPCRGSVKLPPDQKPAAWPSRRGSLAAT